jgi:hypothetical protein
VSSRASLGSASALRIESAVDAPTRARAHTREVLAAWGFEGCSRNVELLVTELVANVVVHVGGPIALRLVTLSRGVRVEVDDSSTALPRPRRPAADDVHGRGMLLVASLASRWGTERRRDGKTVWFEVDASADEAAV